MKPEDGDYAKCTSCQEPMKGMKQIISNRRICWECEKEAEQALRELNGITDGEGA